jgi:hypothetical protein
VTSAVTVERMAEPALESPGAFATKGGTLPLVVMAFRPRLNPCSEDKRTASRGFQVPGR